jgi:hypothetical protein
VFLKKHNVSRRDHDFFLGLMPRIMTMFFDIVIFVLAVRQVQVVKLTFYIRELLMLRNTGHMVQIQLPQVEV